MRKYPYYHQLDAMQCGVTCLRMLTRYYGRRCSIGMLEEVCPPTSEGVSILAINKAAEKLGFRTLCGRFALDALENVSLPCVLHWNQNHFVVLYEVRKRRGRVSYLIGDPAKGLVSRSREEMEESWVSTVSHGREKGVALLLEPTPRFWELQEPASAGTHTFTFLLRYLLRYKSFLGQVALGMCMGCALQLVYPLLTQAIVDIGIRCRDMDFIYMVLAGQVALAVGGTLLDFIRRWLFMYIGVRVNISLVSDFFMKLMELPMSFFDTKQTGDILQRINDHGRVQGFLMNSLLSVCFSIASFLVLGFVLLGYSLPIFLVFLVCSVLQGTWIALFLRQRRIIDYETFERQAMDQNKTLQLIEAMQEIKLQGCKRRRRWEWEDVQVGLFETRTRGQKLSQAQELGSFLLGSVKGILIVVMSARLVIDGQLSFGMMLAIQGIVGQLSSPIGQLVNFVYSLQDVRISLERINEICLREDEASGVTNASGMDKLADNTIRIEHLSFKYDVYSPVNVLTDINLEIEQGKTTAIVGASGSGKSTLLKLLLGYSSTYDGRIDIGGVPLRGMDLDRWRSSCGVVMQEGRIFSESIARNIAVGDGDMDFAMLRRAASIANLDDYVESLPLKYNTVIGAEGKGVSMGQKQRILIARAVYKNPDFLFLDEATNSLDATNESEISEHLTDFFCGKTVLVIAHRLSTVRNADKIVVLDGGRIVEVGDHASLTRQGGIYYRLVKNQLML